MKEITYQVMSDSEFNELVKHTYGHEYNFAMDNECGNDSQHTFNKINGVQESYDIEDLEKFKKTGNSFMITRVLLNDMVNKNILPVGNYLITVCW